MWVEVDNDIIILQKKFFLNIPVVFLKIVDDVV